MKIFFLRNVYGSINVHGEWQITYNHELYELYKDPEIIQEIKTTMFRWLGHLFRTY
jgi:hypothetical protein